MPQYIKQRAHISNIVRQTKSRLFKHIPFNNNKNVCLKNKTKNNKQKNRPQSSKPCLKRYRCSITVLMYGMKV